jgi:hypothetical protein
VSNDSISLSLPTGWSLDINNSDESELILDPPDNLDGELEILSQKTKTPGSAQQQFQGFLSKRRQQHPDMKTCGDQGQESWDGVPGVYQPICYTVTPQNGKAFQEVEILWVGAGSGGTVLYKWSIYSTPSGIADFDKAAVAVLRTLRWKLK